MGKPVKMDRYPAKFLRSFLAKKQEGERTKIRELRFSKKDEDFAKREEHIQRLMLLEELLIELGLVIE